MKYLKGFNIVMLVINIILSFSIAFSTAYSTRIIEDFDFVEEYDLPTLVTVLLLCLAYTAFIFLIVNVILKNHELTQDIHQQNELIIKNMTKG